MSERKTEKRRKEKRRGEMRKTQHRAEKCKTAREGISRVEGKKGEGQGTGNCGGAARAKCQYLARGDLSALHRGRQPQGRLWPADRGYL